MIVSPELLEKEKCSTFAILKSILSSVSAVILVSASASKTNSTPFKSTAAAKSFNLADDTAESASEFSTIFDNAIFYILITTIYTLTLMQLQLKLRKHLLLHLLK